MDGSITVLVPKTVMNGNITLACFYNYSIGAQDSDARGMVAEWSKVLTAVPWPFMV